MLIVDRGVKYTAYFKFLLCLSQYDFVIFYKPYFSIFTSYM